MSIFQVSFGNTRPHLEQFKPEIINGVPEKIVADKFMLEGLSEFLRRQSKAKQLKEKSKETAKDGIDLLIQMSGYLDVQIHERKKYLEFLQSGEKQ